MQSVFYTLARRRKRWATTALLVVFLSPPLFAQSLQIEEKAFVVELDDPAVQEAGEMRIIEGDSTTINQGTIIEVVIPDSLDLEWVTDQVGQLGGGAEDKISERRFQGVRIFALEVQEDFLPGEQLVITGLQVRLVDGATATRTRLRLSLDGGVSAPIVSDVTWRIGVLSVEIEPQRFVVGDPSTQLGEVIVQEDTGAGGITAEGQIRLILPAALQMQWDTEIKRASLDGSERDKISPAVLYSEDEREAILTVTADFVAGGDLIISNLHVKGFSAELRGQLELSVSERGEINARSTKELLIGEPVIEIEEQAFVLGDPSTVVKMVTIREGSIPGIADGRLLRLVLSSELQLVWDRSVSGVTLGGSAAGKVSDEVSYSVDGRVAILTVTSDFASGEELAIDGLQVMDFGSMSRGMVSLSLNETGEVNAQSTEELRIGEPGFSIEEQAFVLGDPSTVVKTVTIREGSIPGIADGRFLRLVLPSELQLTWDRSISRVRLGGSAGGKVSDEVSYSVDGRMAILTVMADFAGGDELTIDGLQVMDFGDMSPETTMELWLREDRVYRASENRLRIGQLDVELEQNQLFVVGDPSMVVKRVTIREDAVPGIMADRNLRLVLPDELQLAWDGSVSRVALGGSAAGKVPDEVSYSADGRVATMRVTADFASGDELTIDGLQVTDFGGMSRGVVSVSLNETGEVNAQSIEELLIGEPAVEIEEQAFVVGDPSTKLEAVTIRENAIPGIMADRMLRLLLPPELQLTWDGSVSRVVLDGSAGGKVSDEVTYSADGRVAMMRVTVDFAGGDELTINGLQVMDFGGMARGLVSLSLNETGEVNAQSTNRLRIGRLEFSIEEQAFVVGDPSTVVKSVTIREDAIPGIVEGRLLRLVLPSELQLVWDRSVSGVTLGGSAAGKVADEVSYSADSRMATMRVTADFASGDELTINGLQVTDFWSMSRGVVSVSLNETGEVNAQSADELLIGGPEFSIEEQAFLVGDPSTAVKTVIIKEGEISGLGEGRQIHLVLPVELQLMWDDSVSRVMLGGSAEEKMSDEVTYSADGRVATLMVTANFAGKDSLTIDSLHVTNITKVSSETGMELRLWKDRVYQVSEKTLRIGRLDLRLAQSQIFVVGDPTTEIDSVVIRENLVSAGITAGKEIRLVLPAEMGLQWDVGMEPIISGSEQEKIADSRFADARTYQLDISQDFEKGGMLVITDLYVTDFVYSSMPVGLLIQANSQGRTNVESDSTLAVAQPSFSSAFNQGFALGDEPMVVAAITIIDDPHVAGITANRDVRIVVPDSRAIKWDVTSEPTAKGDVRATAKIINGDTLLVDVEENLDPGDTLVVSGARMVFADLFPRGNLQVSLNGGETINLQDPFWIEVGKPSILTDRYHVFDVDERGGVLDRITIREDSTAASITPENDIRIYLPEGIHWGETGDDTRIPLEGIVSGSAVDKLSQNKEGVIIGPDNRGLLISVETPLEAADELNLIELPMRFARQLPLSPLQLVITPGQKDRDGDGVADEDIGDYLAGVDAEDSFGVGVGNPELSFLSVTPRDTLFVSGDSERSLPRIIIKESDSTAVTNVWDDIFLILPGHFDGTWKQDVNIAFDGSAREKVRAVTTANYLGSDSLRIDVVRNFQPGDELHIIGLTVDSLEVSPRDSLKAGLLGTARLLENVLPMAVGRPELESVVDQSFIVLEDGQGDEVAEVGPLTIRESLFAPSILAEDGIRIVIPRNLAMEWMSPLPLDDLGLTGGGARKLGDPELRGVDTLYFPVIANFRAGEWVQIRGLQAVGFSHVSPGASLQLSVTAGYSINARDKKMKRVGNPVLSSRCRQRFITGISDTLFSLTISEDDSVGSIDSTFSLVIPEGFDAEWDSQSISNLIVHGGASFVSLDGVRAIFRVDRPLGGGAQIAISGLGLLVGEQPSPDAAFSLSVNGGMDDLDDKVKRISGPPAVELRGVPLSSPPDTIFATGDPDTLMSLVVRDTSRVPALIAGQQCPESLLFALPDNDRFHAVWKIIGNQWLIDDLRVSEPELDTLSFRPGNSGAPDTVLASKFFLHIVEDFKTGDSLVVSPIAIGDFQEVSLPQSIALSMLLDTTRQATFTPERLRIGSPTLTSDEDQVFIAELDDSEDRRFIVGGDTLLGPAPCAPLVISEDDLVGTITRHDGIRISIPDTLAMGWLETNSVRVSGNGAEKVQDTALSFLDPFETPKGTFFKTVYFPVERDFNGEEAVRIEGLRLGGFSHPSRRTSLQLSVNGGRSVNAVDTRDKRVGRPRIWTTDPLQRFVVGENNVPAARVFISEDPIEAAITKEREIEIRVSDEIALKLEAAQASYSGGAASKIRTLRLSEDGKSLLIELDRDFEVTSEGPDTLVIDGLFFKGDPTFSEPGKIDSLYSLTATISGNIDDRSPQGAKIGRLRFYSDTSRVSHVFRVADPPQSAPTLTIDDSTSILVGGDVIHIDIADPSMESIEPAFSWIDSGDTVMLAIPGEGNQEKVAVWGDPGDQDTYRIEKPVLNPTAVAGPSFSEDRKRISFVVPNGGLERDEVNISNMTLGRYNVSSEVQLGFSVDLNSVGSTSLLDREERLMGRFKKLDPTSSSVVVPRLASDTLQTFFVGSDATKLAPLKLKMAFGDRLQLILPDSLAADWDESRIADSIQVKVISADQAVLSNVGVRYLSPDDLEVSLEHMLWPEDSLEISGLALRDFSKASRNSPLALSLNGGRTVNALDEEFKRIGDLIFTVRDEEVREHGLQDTMVFLSRKVAPLNRAIFPESLDEQAIIGPDTSMIYPVKITESRVASGLLKGDLVRLVIPQEFNARWSGTYLSLTTIDTNGMSTGKVHYEGMSRDSTAFHLRIREDLSPGETVYVKGLGLTGFTGVSRDTALQLHIRQEFFRESPQRMRIGAPTIGSFTAQGDSVFEEVFLTHYLDSPKTRVIIAENDTAAAIVAERDLLIVVPDSLILEWDTEHMRWDASREGKEMPLDLRVDGNARTKIDSIRPFGVHLYRIQDSHSQEVFLDSTKILRIYVKENFASGDRLVLDNLRLGGFNAPSSGRLEMWPIDARFPIYDHDTLYVGGPSLSSDRTQVFVAGDAPTSIYPVTITDDSRVATIRKDQEIHLMLPETLQAEWNSDEGGSVHLVLGSAEDKVESEARIQGKAVVIRVKETFEPGERLKILNGLALRDFQVSGKSRLEMAFAESDSIRISDLQQKWVGAPWLRFTNVSGAIESLPIDATPAVQKRLDLTIGENDKASSIRAETDIRLAFTRDGTASLTEYLQWDTTGIEVQRNIAGEAGRRLGVALERNGDILAIDVKSDLAPGDTITVKNLGLKIRKSAYQRIEEWATEFPQVDSIGLVVHGGNEAVQYSYRHDGSSYYTISEDTVLIKRVDGDSALVDRAFIAPDVEVINLNRKRMVDFTDTAVEGFLPVLFDDPKAFSTISAHKETTWVEFHSVPGLLDTASWRREFFQIFRDSIGSETLLGVDLFRPPVWGAGEVDVQNSSDFWGRFPVWNIKIPLSEGETRQLNRWFDDSYLGMGETHPKMFVEKGTGLAVRQEEGRLTPYEDRRETDSEDSFVAPLNFTGPISPESVEFPLPPRYFNPRRIDDQRTVIEGFRLADEENLLPVRVVVVNNVDKRIQLGTDEVGRAENVLILNSLLPEGANELRLYFEGDEEGQFSFPVIRQVVIDTTSPQIAQTTDGRLAAAKVMSDGEESVTPDSVYKPQPVVSRQDTNVLQPIAGRGRGERGLSITAADTLRTEIIDNIRLRAKSADDTVGAQVLLVRRNERIEEDSVYFFMPVHPYPVFFEVRGRKSDGSPIALGDGIGPAGTETFLDTLTSGIERAMELTPSFDKVPVNARLDSNGMKLAVDIGLLMNFNFEDTTETSYEDLANFIFPIALLPDELLKDDVSLIFALIATDGAANADTLHLGHAFQYLLKTGEQDGMLVDKMINFPNPFTSLSRLGVPTGTTIRFVLTPQLTEGASVRLRIFDSGGEQVYVADLGEQGAGEHLATWAGYDIYGQPLATGVYFAILEVKTREKTEVIKLKMAILNRR
jgi:hypothetical protein